MHHSRKAPWPFASPRSPLIRGMDVDMRAGLELEKDLAAITFGTEDKQEGMDAFLGKRPPCSIIGKYLPILMERQI